MAYSGRVDEGRTSSVPVTDTVRDQDADRYLGVYNSGGDYPAYRSNALGKSLQVGQRRSRGDITGPLGEQLPDGTGSLPGQASTPMQSAQADGVRAQLDFIIESLKITPRQEQLVRLRIIDGMTLEAIGERVGASKQAVDRELLPVWKAWCLRVLTDRSDGAESMSFVLAQRDRQVAMGQHDRDKPRSLRRVDRMKVDRAV